MSSYNAKNPNGGAIIRLVNGAPTQIFTCWSEYFLLKMSEPPRCSWSFVTEK